TRGYIVTLESYQDDAANRPAEAADLTPGATGSGTQAGSVEVPGDVDVFRYTPTRSGGLTVQLSAAPGSRLDSYLTVLDANGQTPAQNDTAVNTPDARVTLHVTGGQVYYLEAAASPYAIDATAQGAYTLSYTAFNDPDGNSFADATPLALGSAGAVV